MSKAHLIHGDCLKEMKQIPSGTVDMILADPPYGTTTCKGEACRNLNRNFIGIELDENYFRIAESRICGDQASQLNYLYAT